MQIFDMDYLDIPLSKMKSGELIVCHDPQNRLGKPTWGVIRHFEGSPEPKGLFWDKGMAVIFAEAMSVGKSMQPKCKEPGCGLTPPCPDCGRSLIEYNE